MQREFRKTRTITYPFLKWTLDEPKYLRFQGPMFTGKVTAATGSEEAMKPATLAIVVDLATGEEAQVVLGKVLQSLLNENYPDNAYVGRNFEIIQRQPLKADGSPKRYKTYDLAEVEVEEKS